MNQLEQRSAAHNCYNTCYSNGAAFGVFQRFPHSHSTRHYRMLSPPECGCREVLAQPSGPGPRSAALGGTHPQRWQAGQLPVERGQVVVTHRQVLLGRDGERGSAGRWGIHGAPICHHNAAPSRGPSATEAQSISATSLPHRPRLFLHTSRDGVLTPSPPVLLRSTSSSVMSVFCAVSPHLASPIHSDPPCLPRASYQLLQGGQLLRQVAEASAV